MGRVENDRSLRLAAIALDQGLVSGDELIGAIRAWAHSDDKTIGEVLGDRGTLDPARRDLLEATLADETGTRDADATEATEVASADRDDPYATRRDLGEGSTRRQEDDELPGPAPADEPGAASDGRFQVLQFHARGGLGKVSVALDREFDRQVALKEILGVQADNPISRARFILEAEITGKLEHPGIVPVYGRGQSEDGRPYYAMRFIRGESLKEAIDRFHADGALRADPGRRSLRLRELLGRFLDACDAIAYAHSRGVIHRDIKPGQHHARPVRRDPGRRLGPGQAPGRRRGRRAGRRRGPGRVRSGPDQLVGPGLRVDRRRLGDRLAAVHEPRAGRRRLGESRAGDRRLLARLHALLPPDGPRPLRGRRRLRGPAQGL